MRGPAYVLWEITLACNLRCRHCLVGAGRARAGELDREAALAVADELHAVGAGAVCLMGGEPLVRPDWDALAARLSSHGIPVGLATNGLLLDGATARRARDVGVNQIVVSLDGDRATHERIRGAGTFAAALAALAAATAAGVPHRLVVTSVHRDNVAELPAILELLLAAAPGASWAINLTSVRHGARLPLAARPDAATFLRTVEFVAEARARARGRLDVGGAHDMGYCSDRYPDLYGWTWRGCPAGLSALGITAAGLVKGCLALPDDRVDGDLRRERLADVWRDPDRFAYNRRFRPSDLAGACAGCAHGAACRGGCLELGLTMTGEAHHAPFCLHRLERGEAR